MKGLGTPEEKSRKNLNNIPGRNNLLPNESIDTSGVGTSIPISGLNITPRQLGGGFFKPPPGGNNLLPHESKGLGTSGVDTSGGEHSIPREGFRKVREVSFPGGNYSSMNLGD